MVRIYVAGLYSKNSKGKKANVIEVLENIRAGIFVCNRLLSLGYAVYCPWLDFQYGLTGDFEVTEEQYKANSIAWLEVSDAMLVISGAGLWGGVDDEIKRAVVLDIPAYIDEHKLIEEIPPLAKEVK